MENTSTSYIQRDWSRLESRFKGCLDRPQDRGIKKITIKNQAASIREPLNQAAVESKHNREKHTYNYYETYIHFEIFVYSSPDDRDSMADDFVCLCRSSEGNRRLGNMTRNK